MRRVERRRVDDNEIDQWRRLGLSSLIAGPGLVDWVLRHGPLFTLLCQCREDCRIRRPPYEPGGMI